MEKEKRNYTASLLMVTGIIFIVIAGTIFVSTAWKYLPAGGKQCILLLAALGLFAGAGKIAKEGRREKTETALYYLATIFLGLCTLSVCGSIMGIGNRIGNGGSASGFMTGWKEEAIMSACVVMLLPVLARFLKKRKTFDFTCMALLADFILFWFGMSRGYGLFGTSVLSAAGLTAYTAADYLRDKWMGKNQHVEQAFIVLYSIHGGTFILHNLAMLLEEDTLLRKAGLLVMAACMVCITALICISRKQRVFTVFNSIAVYWLMIAGTSFMKEFLLNGMECSWDGEMVHFITFTLCALCMVVFARTEMVWMTAIWSVLVPFVQIFSYGDYDFLFCHINHKVSVYLPFSCVAAAAMAVVIVRKFFAGELDKKKARQYGMAAGLQVLVAFILFYASQYPFLDEGIWSMLAVQFLAISFLFENEAMKRIFETLALLSGEVLVFICTNSLVPADYRVEWGCFLLAACVFLIGVIWKNGGSGMRLLQFICACVILSVMLIHTMINAGVGNALILGMTGVGMLIVAAVFNSRRYVVLSAAVLIIMVFYLTRSFWFSVAWWVYLFAAGVVLVFLAMKKEKASKQG